MGGCQSARIEEQGIGFREALVKMYDEQVWDSLIRAKQNRPFVLLNYTELFAQDAEQVAVSGGGGKLIPSLSDAHTGWFVAGSAGRSGVLNFKATPVVNGIVINSVVHFAQQRLRVSPDRPATCYDFRMRDGQYYYVAAEDAPCFMELAMRASFPIDDTAAQLGFYPLTIAAVIPERPDSAAPGTPVVRFSFTGPVPNGGGLLSTPSGAYELRPIPDRVAGSATRELLGTWRADSPPRDLGALKGTTARFFSTDYPPSAKSVAEQSADLLQKVINAVDRLGAGS